MLTFRTPDTGVEVSTAFVSSGRRAYHGWNALYQSCVRTAGHQSPGPSVPGYAGDGGFLYRRAGYEAGQDEHSTSTPLRHLKATHGDGMLAPYGFASNTDWPMGSTETAGFGCRGGGYYEPNRPYGGLNPYSPRGDRKCAAWPGSARVNADSSHFGRTALPAVIIQ